LLQIQNQASWRHLDLRALTPISSCKFAFKLICLHEATPAGNVAANATLTSLTNKLESGASMGTDSISSDALLLLLETVNKQAAQIK